MKKHITLREYIKDTYTYEIECANRRLLLKVKEAVASMYDHRVRFSPFTAPIVTLKANGSSQILIALHIRNGHMRAVIRPLDAPTMDNIRAKKEDDSKDMDVEIRSVNIRDTLQLAKCVSLAVSVPDIVHRLIDSLPCPAPDNPNVTLVKFLGKRIRQDLKVEYLFMEQLEGCPYRVPLESLAEQIPKPKQQHYYRAVFHIYKKGEMESRPLDKTRIIMAPNMHDAYGKAQETCGTTLLRLPDDVAVCRHSDITPILKDEAMTYDQKKIIK